MFRHVKCAKRPKIKGVMTRSFLLLLGDGYDLVVDLQSELASIWLSLSESWQRVDGFRHLKHVKWSQIIGVMAGRRR